MCRASNKEKGHPAILDLAAFWVSIYFVTPVSVSDMALRAAGYLSRALRFDGMVQTVNLG